MSEEPRPTRAIVITAATARAILITANESPAAQRLERELELGPTFEGMEDGDLAGLMQRLELELHDRGWRPTRQWARAEKRESACK